MLNHLQTTAKFSIIVFTQISFGDGHPSEPALAVAFGLKTTKHVM